MAQGLALTIGLDSVNPAHYAGWSGTLSVCEADAKDMKAIAEAEGFTCTLLLTEKATRAAVIEAIRDAAAVLKPGDAFMISYSGHGGHLPDLNKDEDDFEDETWCLYDGQILDDELYTLWGAFASGVRVFQLSDSCHSGSVIKRLTLNGLAGLGPGASRDMPGDIERDTYQQNKDAYDPILKSSASERAKGSVKASVLLISACEDSQLSYEGSFNGVFTSALKHVWDDGKFDGSYHQFHEQIKAAINNGQNPMLSMVGVKEPGFAASRPFTI